MKRTFIAVRVKPGEKLENFFSKLKDETGGSVKWVESDRMHITLAFLGDTSEDTVKEVSDKLREICGKTSAFSFSITGLGVFRNLHDPKVIYAGIEGSQPLKELFEVIKEALAVLEIPVEERAFSPHLTLGRVKWLKDKKALERMLKEYSGTEFQGVNVTEVIFYESILKPAGPVYIPMKTLKLI
ncbi:MAG: RNA 2',3'-cyclic phosphodiesterase [Bacteroidales bacterium]